MHDGLGERQTTFDARWGRVDIIDLVPELSSPIAEMNIRSAAARLAAARVVTVPSMRAVERQGSTLRVVSEAVEGCRLSALLDALASGDAVVPDEALLELAFMVSTSVAWLHGSASPVCHGTLAPSRIVLKENGQLFLTDALFGDALTRLRHGRDRLWREYGVATPSTAGEAVLDQRVDVTASGMVVLALLLRRPIREDEFPSALADLIMSATATLPEWGVPLRTWLQQAVQLRPGFSSSATAAEQFGRIMASVPKRRDAARALFNGVFPRASIA